MHNPRRTRRVIFTLCTLALLLINPVMGQSRVALGAGMLVNPAQAAQPGPDLAQAVMQSIEADRALSRSDGLVWMIRTMSLSTDGTQALISMALVDPTSNTIQRTEALTVVGTLIPADSSNGTIAQWSISLPGQSDFVSRLESLPSELQDPSVSTELAAQATNQTEAAASPIGGYYLPWANGVTQAMVQGANHPTCLKPSDCYYAFDFAAKYSDPPKFPLLAARGGSVYTFYDSCDDRPENTQTSGNCTNYIVLQDKSTDPTTYQIYLHMSKDTIPANFQQIGAVVRQGDWIGNADNTGASWGSHVHFMVVTTIYNVGYKPPSYPWGASVDITFKDVSINWDAGTQGGRPCGSSDIGYGKCTQAQYYYTSGNQVLNAPTGELIIPDGFQLLTTPFLLAGGSGTDVLGVTRMSMIANYDGSWQDVGPAQTTSPFAVDLDLCAADIPDGPFDLALRIWNKAGNQSPPIGVRHMVKNIPSCPNVPPPAPPVQPCSNPSSGQVVLFIGPNFTGACVTLGLGTYGDSTALAPLPDKSVSSIKVGKNVKAMLYQAVDQGPRRETIIGSDRDLADNRIGSDTVSGMIVAATTGSPQHPILFKVYGPNGADPTSVDSLILTWGWGDGGLEYHANLFQGIAADNSICSSATPPFDTLAWQYGLTWPVGSLPAGDYTWCGQSRYVDILSDWYINTFTVAAGALPTPLAVDVPYSATMEGGINGWTATGLWNQASDPINPANQTWVFNNYNTAYPTNGDLTSPPIIIPNLTSGTQYLRFGYYYQTESSNPYWDQRWVQISQDGGDFQNLLQLSDDAMSTWLQSPFISLAAYAGSTIRIRFHFDAIDTINNSNLAGWYIDNVAINATPPPTNCNETTANNTPASATSINYGAAISASICPAGDVDYYKFQAWQGDVLVAETDAQSLTPPSPLDTVLTLYLDPDTRTVVAENDNSNSPGSAKDSYLRYIIPQTGTYYLRVKAHDSPGVGGADYRYVLKVNKETDVTAPAVTLTNPGPGAGLTGSSTILTATAVDNAGGSGLSHVDFFWHSSDWSTSAWTLIGSDSNGADGWQMPFDTSALPEGTVLSIYVRAVDRAGNPGYSVDWNLVVDRTSPSVTVQSLPPSIQDTAIPIAWTASDPIDGLNHFNLQYNPDGAGWQDWSSPLPGPTRIFWFVGAFGHQYAFRLSGTDNAGNTSPWYTVSTTVEAACQPDSFDGAAGDNTQASAIPLALLSSQTHNFCGLGDTDWVTFTAEKGKTYLIMGRPSPNSAASPILSLFTGDGKSINNLQQLSPVGLAQASLITWTAPEGGTYAVKISSFDPAVAGTGVTYSVEVAEAKFVLLPMVLANASLR